MQSAELTYNARLKPADDIGPWYIERLRNNCSEMAGVILVALNGAAYLGCAVVFTKVEETGEGEEMPSTAAHVCELVVTETARGLGVGSALLAECEVRAKIVGRSEMTIAVYAANEAALRLYRDHGFADAKLNLRKTLS